MTAMVAADFGWAKAGDLPVQRRLTVGFALVCWLAANLLGDRLAQLVPPMITAWAGSGPGPPPR